MSVQLFNESRCFVNMTKLNNTNDFFKETLENNPNKNKFLIFCFILIFLVITVSYSIIWFEKHGSDKKRTIINRCVSSICGTLIIWQLTVQVSTMARILLGPFSHTCCFWFYVLRRALITRVFLLIDAITITRYIFIFWLKNPGAFNDEFWMRYVNLWTTWFCIMIPFVQAFFPNQKLMIYNICIGYHTESQTMSSTMNIGIEIPSIFFQLVLFFRIKIQKWQVCRKRESHQHSHKILDLAAIESGSLLHISQSLVLIIINIFFIFFIVIGTFGQPCFLISRPHTFLVPFSILLVPSLVSLVITCGLIIINPVILKVLFREIKTHVCF